MRVRLIADSENDEDLNALMRVVGSVNKYCRDEPLPQHAVDLYGGGMRRMTDFVTDIGGVAGLDKLKAVITCEPHSEREKAVVDVALYYGTEAIEMLERGRRLAGEEVKEA